MSRSVGLIVTLAMSILVVFRFDDMGRFIAQGTLDQRIATGSIFVLAIIGLAASFGLLKLETTSSLTRSARAGLIIVAAMVAIAFLAPLLALHPLDFDSGIDRLGPSLVHPFGTDYAGRDIFSRVVYGTRVSLGISVGAIFLSTLLGTAVGVLSGLATPTVDSVIMRFVDAGLAFPRLVLLVAIATLWSNVSIIGLILILGLTGWFGLSRLVRAETLTLKHRAFVDAARGIGVTRWRLVRMHLLPNVLSPILVTIALGMGNVILIESGLSFLGYGIQEPVQSWGQVIAYGNDELDRWAMFFPGVAIAVTVIGCSLLGDGLRTSLLRQEERT